MATAARIERATFLGWLIEDVVALAVVLALCSVLIGIVV